MTPLAHVDARGLGGAWVVRVCGEVDLSPFQKERNYCSECLGMAVTVVNVLSQKRGAFQQTSLSRFAGNEVVGH